MKIKMPAAVWSALFLVVITAASMWLDRATLNEVFRQVAIVAALVAMVAAWIAKAWEEYRRGRWPEEKSVHTMDQEMLNPRGFWTRWWWG